MTEKFTDRTEEINWRIAEKEMEGIPFDELRSDYYELGKIAMEEGHFYQAKLAYMQLEDKTKVREVAEICLQKAWYFDAADAFGFIGDREGVLRAIQEMEQKEGPALIEVTKFSLSRRYNISISDIVID